jgi:hypothetical protein
VENFQVRWTRSGPCKQPYVCARSLTEIEARDVRRSVIEMSELG